MPATIKPVLTGDPDIDGLIEVNQWAVQSLSFGFPTAGSAYSGDYAAGGEPSKNFSALTAAQQDASRAVLASIASVANLSFTELTGAAAGKADLRIGRTDGTLAGHAYTPSAHPAGGDVWFARSGDFALAAAPVAGSYAFAAMLHEIGHAVGLKHGHQAYTVAANGAARPTMSAAHDSMEYSVMTYRSYVGGPANIYSNEAAGFAQTLMMYDIAALQHLYGANYASNAGNSVYGWNPSTGEMSLNGQGQGAPAGNRIFMTLWDGGGVDTYSFAKYTTDVFVDLRPGEWSTASTAQLAKLGVGEVAHGNIANALLYKGNARSLIENAEGGSGNDRLSGNDAVNALSGGDGNDLLDGKRGGDTLNGGAGNDIFIVDHAGDRLGEAAGGGSDTVRSTVSFSLVRSQIEHLQLTGRADADAAGNGFGNRLTGNGGANLLSGDAGNDAIVAGAGADGLFGGAGSDRLTGGTGADSFHFDATLGATNIDLILDFGADDHIRLDRDIFGAIAADGALARGAFRLGSVAADRDDRILYDAASGKLFYDADGDGAGAARLFAKVDPGTVLSSADFIAYI
jgi:serralysin